jgi:xanthine dehydrogenase accessory factor
VGTVIAGPGLGQHLALAPGHDAPVGPLDGPNRERAHGALRTALQTGQPLRVVEGPWELFVDVLVPVSTLVVVGGVHIAIALVALARTLGYRTVVIDPRPAFANRERFPHADRIEAAWPDEALERVALTPSTAVAVLTHDPKLDDPALRAALRSDAFYVGALGSRRTQEKRRERLRESGLTDAQLDRLHC